MVKVVFGGGRGPRRPNIVLRPGGPNVVVREDVTTNADIVRLVEIAKVNKPDEVPTQEGWEKMINLVIAGMSGPNR